MSAVDEIQKAIGILELQRDEPQPPYFDRWNDEDFTYGNLDDAVEEGFEYGQAYGEWKAGRHLIDVQLAILQETLFQLSGSAHARGFIGNEFTLFARLASAITGSTS